MAQRGNISGKLFFISGVVVSSVVVVLLSLGRSLDFLELPVFSTHEAEKVTGAQIDEYGLYTVSREGGRALAPDTPEGFTEVFSGADLERQTLEIPAELRRAFGFKFTVQGEPTGAHASLTMKIVVPEDVNYDKGFPYKIQSWKTDYLIGEKDYIGFVFDKESEIIEGSWRLQVYYRNQLLVEKTFRVFDARE